MRPIIALAFMIAVIVALSLVSRAPSPAPVFESFHTMPGGELTFGVPEAFALAVTPEQFLVSSYIPPCDTSFDYCLYYLGSGYVGTNFESAGLRVKKRDDLDTAATCLSTSPRGYELMKPKLFEGEGYGTARFAPLGDAAAGHYTSGALYRLTYESACYEFETRIGESQFANYPEGSIREFTKRDRGNMGKTLRGILESVTLRGKKVIFPLSTV